MKEDLITTGAESIKEYWTHYLNLLKIKKWRRFLHHGFKENEKYWNSYSIFCNRVVNKH